MKRFLLFFLLLPEVFIFSLQAQDEARLLRFPAIYGDQVVFSAGGDLYTVARTGGIARKLTSYVGYEMFPCFSPDGKTIAFTGQYDGNTEVFVIPAVGGIPKRLTFTATLDRDDVSDRMGPNNIVLGWTPDGKYITYRSRKQSFNSFRGALFNVPVNGGLSEELPLINGGFCSWSSDGKKLALNRVFREFRTWKYYQGGMADDVWIYDTETHQIENITNNPHQDIIPMWAGREIFFLSDRDRTMNLFAYNLDTRQTTKVTNFTDYDIKFPSIGGNYIVFEKGGYLYTFDIKTWKTEKIPVIIADDNLFARNEIKDASQSIHTADLSPDGERVLFGARGEVFSVPAKKGITRNLTQTPGVHERNPNWSPDGKYIAWISDENGEFEIYIRRSDGSEKPVQVTKGADTYYFNISWSPDSKKILFNDRKLRLRYVDIDSRKVVLVRQAVYGTIYQFAWSPDSRYITYTEQTENDNSVIRIFDTQTNKTYDITDNWFSSSSPEFSNDGKYLVFTSARDFNPIFSQTEWNHAYTDMTRVYFVLLSRDTSNPFAPKNDEVKIQKTQPSATAKESEKGKEKGKGKTEETKVGETSSTVSVKIDFDDIGKRIISLPIDPSNYGNVSCIDGIVYYNEYGGRRRQDGMKLKMYNLKEQKETELGNYRYTLSPNNKKMLVVQGNQYAVIDLPKGPITFKETVDLSNMKVMTDYAQEWKQIFDESWRQMRDFFYVENMHGVDWSKMHDKYAVLVPYVRHRADLTYIIGEMIGELTVGHSYVNSGEMPKPPRIKTGLLGAKLSKDASGYYKVDQILEGANWSRELRSPLTEPGNEVNEGEFILAVDGNDVQNAKDLYSFLVGKSGTIVELTVNSKPSMEGSRKVLVTLIDDEASLYYYNWVQRNIRLVDEKTNGQVGYLHIPDMGIEGLNEYAKYFYPQLAKKGLIIDDRGNGGGNVSPMIVDRLSRQVTRSNMTRNVTVPRYTPGEAFLGPKVLLIDNYSASDGDLFPYAFRKHNLGTIIGKRTWGGVVGITGPLPFIDGADLRIPQFASYSAEKSEWIIEGYGVDPDIEVDNDPYKEYMGEDAQLNKAIEVILEQIKNYKGIPSIPPAPDKSK